MLFKYRPKPDTKPEDLLSVDLVNAGKITSVSENTSDDIQDYDLKLDNGLDVHLYVENCDGKKPKVGDYFFIKPFSSVYLYSAEEFEAEYSAAE